MAEKLLFEIQLDTAEATKRAAALTAKIANLQGERRDLNKQLKELQKEEKQLSKDRLEAEGRLKNLTAEEKANASIVGLAEQRVAELTASQRTQAASIAEVSNELVTLQSTLKGAQGEQRRLIKELDAGPGSLQESRNELSRLKKEWANFSVGIDGSDEDLEELTRTIAKLNDEIFEQEKKVGVFSRNVGNYKNDILSAFDSIPGPLGNVSSGLKGLATIPGPVALIGAIGTAGAALIAFQQQLEDTRQKVQELTGASGNELNNIVAVSQATADVFKVNVEDVAQTSNAIAKQFGTDLTKVGNDLQVAFSVGGDASGELLSSLKEYSPQFKEAGFSAEQFIAIAAQQPQTGVFGDKGLDSIKEATIRLRELTPATRDALDGIGLVSTEIEGGLRDGSQSIFDVIQQVSGRLDELPPQSKEVGTAIADIFGGPGEDAGLQYLTTLKDIKTDLSEVEKESTVFAQTQLKLADANERINLTLNQLFGTADGVFDGIIADGKTYLADVLEKMVAGTVTLINYFIDLYNESTAFRGVVQTIGASFKNIGDIAGGLFDTLKNGFSTVGGLFDAIFRGNFSDIPGILKEGFGEAVDIAKKTGKDVVENYSEAFENTFNQREKIELFSLDSEETIEARKKAKQAGKSVASAFNESVKTNIDTTNQATNTNTTTDKKEVDTTELEARKATLQAELLAVKSASDEEISIRKSLAEQRRAIALEDASLTATEKIEIEKQYQTSIAEIDNISKDTNIEEDLENLRQLAEIKRETALEQANLTQSEILEIEKTYQTTITEIRNQSNEINIEAQRQSLEEELNLRRQLAETSRDIALKEEGLTAEQKILIQAEYLIEIGEINNESAEAELERIQEAFQKELTELELNRTNKIITEEEYFEKLNEIRLVQLEYEAEQFDEGSQARLEKELEIAELRADGLIEQTERITAAEQKAEAERVKSEAAKRRLTDDTLRAALGATQAVIDATEEESGARKAAVAIQKGLAVAEVGINLARTISTAIAAGAKFALDVQPAPVGAALGAIYQAVTIASAIASSAAQLANIAGVTLEGGGFTDGKDGGQFVVTQNGEIVPAFAGGGFTFEGQPVSERRDFADGGFISRPTLGLIGERGTEFVVNNNTLKSTEGAFHVRELTKLQTGSYQAFADGGFTANVAGASTFQQASNNANIAEFISELPRPVVFVEDIRTGVDSQVSVENDASF